MSGPRHSDQTPRGRPRTACAGRGKHRGWNHSTPWEVTAMARGPRRAALRPRFEVLESRRLLSGDVRPNDPSFGRQYGLSSPTDADIDAPAAWSLTTGRPTTLV